MTTAAIPNVLSRRSWRGLIALLLGLFLGLLSFAAVNRMKVECGPEYLVSERTGSILTGNGALLTTGRQQCQVTADEFRIPLPSWLPRGFW